MELIAKELYHGGFGTLGVGESTERYDLPEELKQQLLEDHPEMFEVAGVVAKPAPQDELNIETPESNLTIETGEAKMSKTTRKK